MNEIFDKIDPYPGNSDDHLHLLYGDRYDPADNPLLQFSENGIYQDHGDRNPFIWHPTNAFAKRLAFYV
jgi:hypothetical protein